MAALLTTLGISILAPRAGRDVVCCISPAWAFISIVAPRAGRDALRRHAYGGAEAISILAPRAGRDHALAPPFPAVFISILAPRAGRDAVRDLDALRLRNFNPRAPCGARLGYETIGMEEIGFQSSRPVRGATAVRLHGHGQRGRISILAPRAGRDMPACSRRIRAARFQSSRPVRGATTASSLSRRRSPNFNPRAPCGARPRFFIRSDGAVNISILAPRAGRDPRLIRSCRPPHRFQSSRPVRGATWSAPGAEPRRRISILAPRAGRDNDNKGNTEHKGISILAPRAGRDTPGGISFWG